MSSSLAVQPCADVDVWPLNVNIAARHVELWEALQRTNVDVALNPSEDVWRWAESCVYVGEVQKLVSSLPRSSEVELNSSDSHVIQREWETVEQGWFAPTTIGFRDPQTEYSSQQDFAYIDQDLSSRVINMPEDVKDRGSLREYAPLYFVQEDGRQKLYHVYLYDHVLLFVNDSDNSSPVSPDDPPRSSSLNIAGVVHLVDITDIFHAFKRIGEHPAYALRLTVFMTDKLNHTMSLILPTSRSLWSWSTALRLRMTIRSQSNWTVTQTDFLAKGMLAVTHWPFDTVPLHRYGKLQRYSPVSIRKGETCAQVGVYLFWKHLVFMYKTKHGELMVLLDVLIADIVDVYKQSRTVGFVVDAKDKRHIDLQFECDSRTSASTWATMIQERTRKIRRGAEARALTNATSSQDWHAGAGMVLLSYSAENEGEYNISVAIHSIYRGEGLATHAVAHGLKVAFDSLKAHRVQARILHGPDQAAAQDAVYRFLHWGFTHEGTRRQVVRSADGSYKDMSVLSLLDTEWALRETRPPPKETLWDELFARHQRERDSLSMEASGAHVQAWGDAFPEFTPNPSNSGDVQSSANTPSIPDSRITRLDAAPPSEAGTGSSWAAILDVPADSEPLSDQIRRWIKQQSLDLPDTAQPPNDLE